MFDLRNRALFTQVLAPAAVSDNTVQTCTTVDNSGFNSLTFVISLGSIADADATFAVTMLDSPDNSVFTAVDSTKIIGSLASAGFQFDSDNSVRSVGYSGVQRYVRLVITPTANSSAATFGVTAIQADPRDLPTVNS